MSWRQTRAPDEELLTKVDRDDRLSRKRTERMKEGYKERLEALSTRKDDLLTISEISIDQIIVDEAQSSGSSASQPTCRRSRASSPMARSGPGISM